MPQLNWWKMWVRDGVVILRISLRSFFSFLQRNSPLRICRAKISSSCSSTARKTSNANECLHASTSPKWTHDKESRVLLNALALPFFTPTTIQLASTNPLSSQWFIIFKKQKKNQKKNHFYTFRKNLFFKNVVFKKVVFFV